MKCNVDVRKIGIKCEFDNLDEFLGARTKVIDTIGELFNVKYTDDKFQDSLFVKRVIKSGRKQIGTIYSGVYQTTENFKRLEKYYFYIVIEEQFKKNKSFNITVSDDEVEDSDFQFLLNIISNTLNENEIEFSLLNLTVTVKIPNYKGEIRDGSVVLLSSLKNRDNEDNIRENNFNFIDHDYAQNVNIFNTATKMEIDFNIKRNYIFSPGLNLEDIKDLINKEFIIALFPITDTLIGTYDKMSYKSITEEELNLLKENDRIISCNFSNLDNLFKILN